MQREELVAKIEESLIELFKLDPQKVNAEALLSEDLDLDSIDLFDLLAKAEEFTEIELSPEDFKDCRSIGDLADKMIELKTQETKAA